MQNTLSGSENNIHRGLKNKIIKILERCDFDKLDSELHVSYNKPDTDNFSMDVCAIHGEHLIIIECKSSDDKLKETIDHALVNWQKVVDNKIKYVLCSDRSTIKLNDLKNVKQIHYGIAIQKSESKEETIQKRIESEGMIFWGNEAVNYFYKASKILLSAEKYEILREFGVEPEVGDIHPEDAVKLKQGKNEIYLLGIHPSRLIEMGYVFRRTSHRTNSYQRIIKGKKLEGLSKFYKTNKDLLLANSVIIAFDDDRNIQKQIKWDPTDKKLYFPTSYCCAWIIDGQHRIYGFSDTKYKKVTKEKEKEFKIPIVAFKKLELDKQSKTFVEINYNQNKIDPVLIHDLASTFPYPKNELTWASLIVKKLNERSPWKDMIQTSQNEPRKSISITGFVKPVLLNTLLGYDPSTGKYTGSLNKVSPLNQKKTTSSKENNKALETQLSILTRFFESVKKNTEGKTKATNKWLNSTNYAVTRFSGVNALLVVLNAILKKYKFANVDLDDYLSVLKDVDFSQKRLSKISRGFGQVEKLSEEIIDKMNVHTGENFKPEYPKRY
ncbi:DGQHR domain-containing protein [Nitrosopumilus sp. S4]